MYKKLILCIIMLSLGSFGFSPGCGEVKDTKINYYVNSTAELMDLAYNDSHGKKHLLTISEFPLDYSFYSYNDNCAYLRIFNVEYSDSDDTHFVEAIIFKNNVLLSNGFCDDPNNCFIELTN